MGMDNKKCIICGNLSIYKFKCCLEPFCSIACSKNHQECKRLESNEVLSKKEEDYMIEDYFAGSSEDILTPNQINQLISNQKILDYLSIDRIKDAIIDINNSPDKIK